MKEMSLANGRSYLLNDKEAETVIKAMASQDKGLVLLERLGMAINIATIMSVADPELVPYFWGNPMNPAKTKVLVDGEWKTFAGTPDQIEMRLKINPDITFEEYEKIDGPKPDGEDKSFVERYLKSS